MIDMTESIAPKSDQMNAEDLLTGPRTFTITDVRNPGGEQPIAIVLAEFPQGRPFKPSKTVRRILVAAWGRDASQYVGKRMTLFRDASVKWAGEEIGGIRVSHLSHIDRPLTVALTVTRGKRAQHTVQPLGDEPAATPAAGSFNARSALGKAMFAALAEIGITAPADLIAFVCKAIGREISSSSELTEIEAEQVIAAAREIAEPERTDEPAEGGQ